MNELNFLIPEKEEVISKIKEDTGEDLSTLLLLYCKALYYQLNEASVVKNKILQYPPWVIILKCDKIFMAMVQDQSLKVEDFKTYADPLEKLIMKF